MQVETKTTPSFSRLFKECVFSAEDVIRLDRPLVDFFYHPSVQTAETLVSKAVVPLVSIGSASVLGPAFGIYVFVLNIFAEGLYSVLKQDFKEEFRRLPNWEDYFSKQKALPKIALGLLAWFPTIFLENILGNCIHSLFTYFNLPLSGAQDVGLLLSSGGLAGLIWIFLACVFAPVTEEILFRGYLQDLLQDKENPSSWSRFVTAVKTNAVFGAVHISPFQGWYNIPIFVTLFCMGMSMSLLKEISGDLWAPVTCHMANNMIATALLNL